MSWYTIVQFGSYADCGFAPRGPFRGKDEAFDALYRFLAKLGADAGSFQAATSVRVVGPYRTRDLARNADISTDQRIARDDRRV